MSATQFMFYTNNPALCAGQANAQLELRNFVETAQKDLSGKAESELIKNFEEFRQHAASLEPGKALPRAEMAAAQVVTQSTRKFSTQSRGSTKSGFYQLFQGGKENSLPKMNSQSIGSTKFKVTKSASGLIALVGVSLVMPKVQIGGKFKD